MKEHNTKRNLRIVELFIEEHKTLNDIGIEFGLTRERIRQLLVMCVGRDEMKAYLVDNQKFRKAKFDNALPERSCPNCGKIFKSRIKTKRYCSRDCSKEHKHKIATDPVMIAKRRARSYETMKAWHVRNPGKTKLYNQRSKINRESDPVRLARHNKRVKIYNSRARERGIIKYGSVEAYKEYKKNLSHNAYLRRLNKLK